MKTKDADHRIDILNNLSKTEKEIGNYDVALAHLKEVIKICDRTRNIKSKGNAYEDIGTIFRSKENAKDAETNYLIALNLHKKAKNDYGYVNTCNKIGEIYIYEFHDYLKALQYFKEALAVSEKQKEEKQISLSLGNIVMCYRFLDAYPEAFKYSKEALKISPKIKDSSGISAAYQALGQIHLHTKDDKKSLDYFQKALKISESQKDYSNMLQCYTWIAGAYDKQNQPDKVLEYIIKYWI